MTLSRVSRVLKCDIGTLKLELSSQIQNYPQLYYIPKKEIVGVSHKGLPLFIVVNYALEEMKKLFYTPNRFEKILYEKAAKSEHTNSFFDEVQDITRSSNSLSAFLLEHFFSYAIVKFGPLGSICSKDAESWTTTVTVYDVFGHDRTFKLLALHQNDQRLLACISFLRKNPIFLRSYLSENETISSNEMQSLENLHLLSFDREQDIYHLSLPLIYPWHMSCRVIRFLLIEDYCRRIYRNFGLKLRNPLSVSDTSNLMLELMKTKKNTIKNAWTILDLLRDFSNNIDSILYGEEQDASKVFSTDISFPIHFENPNTFGRILWALGKVPSIMEYMPFDWFRVVVVEAIETSRLINATSEISGFTEEASILLTSTSVARNMLIISKRFGLVPSLESSENGILLVFDLKRDMKRIGLISSIGESDHEPSIQGLVFEILNEVQRARPTHSILLREIAARLEIDLQFLLTFIRRYLKYSVDLNIPGEIAPRRDPWLEMN